MQQRNEHGKGKVIRLRKWHYFKYAVFTFLAYKQAIKGIAR